MKEKIIKTLERLYKEYGYAHPIQTRPAPEKGFTGEDPEKGVEDRDKYYKKVEKEKEERKDKLAKDPGGISDLR